jgi:hypothetical protein
MSTDFQKLAMERALAASRAQKAWITNRRDEGLAALAQLHAPGLRALLVQGGDAVRNALRTSLEVTTSALLQWWFREDDDQSWRLLLVPDADGRLALGGLASNAALLRLAGSAVVDAPSVGIDPQQFARTTPARQARALAHVCLTTDAVAPIDYAALYRATVPELRPFLASWMLASYLSSPDHRLLPAACEHQTAGRAAFAEIHGQARPEPVPAQLAFTMAAYRAALDETSPRPFLEALDLAVHGPALPQYGLPAGAPQARAGEVGVFLEAAGEGGKIQRRGGLTLELLRRRGARGVLVGEQLETAYANLPAAWRDPATEVVGLPGASTMEGLAQSAAGLRSEGFDLLVYPHTSLGLGARWLSAQRLARVQVTLGLDGLSSGSRAVDYAVVGQDLALDGEEWSEDLLVVPGLGLDIAPPPTAKAQRQRPAADRECLLVATQTAEKLSGPLLQLWSQILERSGRRACLQFYPGLSEQQAQGLESVLVPHFSGEVDALLVPQVERTAIADALVEADLFLDTYPLGGLGSLVEALASGCPVLTLEGDSNRNRIGAALLRRLGLPSFLIARNGDEYVAAALRLIQEPSLRADLRAQLTRERVLGTLIDPELPNHVGAALDLAVRLGQRRHGVRSAPRSVIDGTARTARRAG